MIQIRKASDRGSFDHGWLQTAHTFSFGDYYDPRFMGFRALRVINEDHVQPGKGFGTHGHRDMEIITYVLEGELEHKDSMGNGSVIRPGEIQAMAAGTGVTHSEFNHSSTQPVHLLQIWILPDREGHEPSYQQRPLDLKKLEGGLLLMAAPEGNEDVVGIHQDAQVYASRLKAGQRVEHGLAPGRHAWVQVARGDIVLNGQILNQGDGAAISDENPLTFSTPSYGEFLLFDLA